MFVCCETARRDDAPSICYQRAAISRSPFWGDRQVRARHGESLTGLALETAIPWVRRSRTNVRTAGYSPSALSGFFIGADDLSRRGKFASLDTEEFLAGGESIGERVVAFLKQPDEFVCE